ncbi:MAG: hypothetical protein NTV36_01675 [Candidatus Staskawiczbacteria bacterium]|nr:hypothetical protein [Candidatus Staskawiczbacteria bacterium]
MSRSIFAEGKAPKIELVLTETQRVQVEAPEGCVGWDEDDVYVRWECPTRIIDLGRAGYDFLANGSDDPRAEAMQLMQLVLAVRNKCWNGNLDEFDPTLILVDDIRRKPRREVKLSQLRKELGQEIRKWEDYFAGLEG